MAFCGKAQLVKNPVLVIEGGKITGIKTKTQGILLYRGIPYAAPPVGQLRWREPQPVIAWSGIKVADKFGDAAVQDDQEIGGFYQHEFYQTGDPRRSEDCLYLNVWTPASGETNRKISVAMYIHGGGFVHGFGSEIEFDGDAWAKRGVILVTINYRLGPLGFLSHPALTAESPNHTSGNQGILDQIAALKWIKNNIAQFGGDPNNVTVFGQSAGGAAVGYLCTSPLTQNLINKAIIMSGGGVVTSLAGNGPKTVAEDQEAAKSMYDYFGLTTIQQMRNYSAKDLFSLSDKYRQVMEKQTGFVSPPSPIGRVADSHNFKINGYQSYQELMGPMTIKAQWAVAQNPPLASIGDIVQHPVIKLPSSGPIIDGYSIAQTFSDAVRSGNLHHIPYMIGSVGNDVAFLAKGIDEFCLLNEQQGNTAYAYQFTRELPGDDAGPFHSGELWYIFRTLDQSWRPVTKADYALSEKMVDRWTNFAKFGDPNSKNDEVWKPFTKENKQVYTFDISK